MRAGQMRGGERPDDVAASTDAEAQSAASGA
jgi:hypothetical protein